MVEYQIIIEYHKGICHNNHIDITNKDTVHTKNSKEVKSLINYSVSSFHVSYVSMVPKNKM